MTVEAEPTTQNAQVVQEDKQETVNTPAETSETQDQPKGEDKVKADIERAKKEGVSVEEFEKVRAALHKANQEAANYRHKASEWEELGVDKDSVKSLLEQQREAEIKELEKQKKYEEILDKVRSETAEKIAKAEGRVTEMQSKLEKQLKEKALQAALIEADAVPSLLQPHLDKFVTLEEREGEFAVRVVDENGQPMLNDQGVEMGVKEFVGTFKEHPEFKYAFKAPKVTGTGANKGSESRNSAPAAPKQKRSQMSDTDKQAYIREHGIEKYQKLPM